MTNTEHHDDPLGQDEYAARAAATTVTLDRTSGMLVDHLRGLIDAEPVRPDPDNHVGHAYLTVARDYEEWAANVAAIRLLLGVRLVNAAMETTP